MTKISFIWDFDGTLVDSYEAILEALATLYAHYQLPFDREQVRSYILQTSTGHLLADLEKRYGLDQQELKAYFSMEQVLRDHMIQLMPGAKKVLEKMHQAGIVHFIYTHKGDTTQAVLENLGIAHYFEEVVTSANGFKRKPDPEGASYLIRKYHLAPERTYYIGDRLLDMDLARQAGILSINLTQDSNAYNQKISDLTDILDMSFDL